jgi:two-component system sensor histidine kinase MprB
VRLELDVAGEVAPVRGRDDGAARVLQNLLDNAVKHSPTGGVVDVVVARTGDGGVVVSVRDHGPGLPPGDAERLFELFARGPEGGATPGFGIGLHVVRAWTRAMGGTVRAADASGGGAVFECRFPPAPHADPEAPRP